MEIIHELWLCEDCMIYAVNGDEPCDSPDGWTPEGVNSLGMHLAPNFGGGAEEDEDEGILEFSWCECDACHTVHGGSRHRFAVLG